MIAGHQPPPRSRSTNPPSDSEQRDAIVSTAAWPRLRGGEHSHLAILSDEFLMEVRQSARPNLAVETLRRLLEGNIKSRERVNVIAARKLSDRLDDVLTRYHKGAVDSLQVIDELIALARDVAAASKRGLILGSIRRSWPSWRRTVQPRN